MFKKTVNVCAEKKKEEHVCLENTNICTEKRGRMCIGRKEEECV